MSESSMAERIGRVQERIAAAARRAGRDPAEITLVAVSKTLPAEVVAQAYRVGLRVFGENRVEEAAPKAAAVAALLAPDPPPTWHMVGHVQSRKANDVLPWASVVHSVDSIRLAAHLSRAVQMRAPAGEMGLPILLEVNVSGEASKYGLAPDELPATTAACAALPGLRIAGLMTVAPIVAAAEDARPIFTALRRLRDDLARQFPALPLQHLSMGMTDDFEIAIEEGATLVRIGRAIFGERAIVR